MLSEKLVAIQLENISTIINSNISSDDDKTYNKLKKYIEKAINNINVLINKKQLNNSVCGNMINCPLPVTSTIYTYIHPILGNMQNFFNTPSIMNINIPNIYKDMYDYIIKRKTIYPEKQNISKFFDILHSLYTKSGKYSYETYFDIAKALYDNYEGRAMIYSYGVFGESIICTYSGTKNINNSKIDMYNMGTGIYLGTDNNTICYLDNVNYCFDSNEKTICDKISTILNKLYGWSFNILVKTLDDTHMIIMVLLD